MKHLKKPVSIKKIRKYKNDIKNTNFSIVNQNQFISKNGVVKSSLFEKMLDLGSSVSVSRLKGGYFYAKKDQIGSDAYFVFQNKNIIDFENRYLNLPLTNKPNFFLTGTYIRFLFNLIANKKHNHN